MLTSFTAKPRDSACSFSLVATPFELPVCEPYKIVNAAASPALGAAPTAPPRAAVFAFAAR